MSFFDFLCPWVFRSQMFVVERQHTSHSLFYDWLENISTQKGDASQYSIEMVCNRRRRQLIIHTAARRITVDSTSVQHEKIPLLSLRVTHPKLEYAQ
jgi:hypothetical protein